MYAKITQEPSFHHLPEVKQEDDLNLVDFVETPQNRSCYDTLCFTANVSISGAGAITLIALRIFMTFSSPVNALLMGGAGMCLQYCVQYIPPIKNVASHIIGDYSADIFLSLTQVAVNNSTYPVINDVINASLFSLFGAQVIQVGNALWNLTVDDDRTAETVPLIQTNTRFIKILTGKNSYERWIHEAVKGAIGITLITTGYVYSKHWSMLSKLGWIVSGHAFGGMIHELMHTLRIYFERKYPVVTSASFPPPETVNMHRSVYVMRMLEKIAYIVSIALPGIFLGFNLSPTDCFAGACMGIKRNIDMVRISNTPVHQLKELERNPDSETRSTLERVGLVFQAFCNCRLPEGQLVWMTLLDVSKYAFGILGVGAFIIWNMVIGTPDTQLTLGTAGALLYLSYIFARLINKTNLDENTNRGLSTAYFYTHYSLAAPIFYIAITQWMQIGDIALDTYGTFKLILDILAWSSLTWSLGTLAAERSSGRNRPYPAPVNAVGMALAADWWFQNVLPLIGINPTGD